MWLHRQAVNFVTIKTNCELLSPRLYCSTLINVYSSFTGCVKEPRQEVDLDVTRRRSHRGSATDGTVSFTCDVGAQLNCCSGFWDSLTSKLYWLDIQNQKVEKNTALSRTRYYFNSFCPSLSKSYWHRSVFLMQEWACPHVLFKRKE